MNEILINFKLQNRAKRVGERRGRGKKMLSSMVVNEELPQ